VHDILVGVRLQLGVLGLHSNTIHVVIILGAFPLF
jgi:hypothetical protein